MAIGVVGYREVSKIFAAAFGRRTYADASVWDTNVNDPARSVMEQTHADCAGILACRASEDLGRRAGVIFSVVAAGQTRRGRRSSRVV